MKRIFMTNAVLLLSLVTLTACPNNDRGGNPAATQLQAPPPIPPPGGGFPTNPSALDPSIKSFQCEFEGQRYGHHSVKYIPKTTSLITLGGDFEQTVNLRSKFILDKFFGNFGSINLRFIPASKAEKSGTDTVVLVNEGLNKNMRMSQSGFAGHEVKLAAQDENMSISVSCKGTTQFKTGPAHTGKTNLVCNGISSTALTAEEEFEKIIPLNSVVAGESFEISQAVSAKLDSAATTITYSGSIDPGYAPEVTSTASLKSAATFTLRGKAVGQDSLTKINVTCRIQ